MQKIGDAMKKKPKIAVIIPVYNEEKSIERVIRDADRHFSKHYDHYDILVVNDASTDSTLKILNSLKKEIKHLKVYTNNKNMGKTQTVMRGFALTNAEIISFIDADYQYDPKDLITVIGKVEEGYDICSGKRKNRHDTIYRKILSKGFNFFNRTMFGIKLSDVNCGLKAFKRGTMDKIKLKYLKAPWFIDTETLAKAYKQHLKITEVDISHYHRTTGKSKIKTYALVTETLFYGLLLKRDLMRKN